MPRVSVITPTWNRHEVLLTRCIPSVQAQTYHDFVHVVVSDGSDYALLEVLPDLLELPEHAGGLGAAARNFGVESTISELVAFLDDDNAFRPNHLAVLVGALDANPQADFAYGRMAYPGSDSVIGCYPPQYGQIDSSMFVCRRKTMELGMWPVPPAGYALDWELIGGWMAKGAQAVFVPEITVDYYRS